MVGEWRFCAIEDIKSVRPCKTCVSGNVLFGQYIVSCRYHTQLSILWPCPCYVSASQNNPYCCPYGKQNRFPKYVSWLGDNWKTNAKARTEVPINREEQSVQTQYSLGKYAFVLLFSIFGVLYHSSRKVHFAFWKKQHSHFAIKRYNQSLVYPHCTHCMIDLGYSQTVLYFETCFHVGIPR